MATIRDVSKLANVSIATVSRVINNDTTYKMTKETRNRVWSAIRELQYVPKSKASQTTDTENPVPVEDKNLRIGCILSITEKKYNDPYFVSILAGAESRLKELGIDFEFIKTGPEMEITKNLYTTFSEPITGLLLMVNLSEETYAFVNKRCSVIVGIDTNHEDIDNVGYNHYKVAIVAVKHLIEKGHTRIGYIGGSGPSGDIRQSQRYQGYHATLHSAGIDLNPKWVVDCAWNEDILIDKVSKLIESGDYPTAFFVGSDLMAMAVMSYFYERNIRVPEDVAIIGLSNIEVSKYSNPPLTTIHIPTKDIGIAAVNLLLDRINGDKFLPRNVSLPTTVIPRSST